MSAMREVAPARPSGASEAARFKRDTADRLVAYRSKWGPGCMGRLAALCGGNVNADKLTRMCDRERFPVEMWRLVAAALDAAKSYKAEAEAARKKLAASGNEGLIKFKTLFDQTVENVNRLAELLHQQPEGEREKLRRAMQALSQQIGGIAI